MSQTTNNTKLSETQMAALHRLAVSTFEVVPNGYSTAGRDAARWWRTMEILAKAGLARQRPGVAAFSITKAGILRLGGVASDLRVD